MTLKIKTILFIILTFIEFSINAQNKYISIGNSFNGFCIGSPHHYNGVRVNFLDENITKFNGLSISGFLDIQKLNGLSIGLFGGDIANSNGIVINGLYSGGTHNGISITGLWSNTELVNGISISCLNAGQKYNGVSIGLWTIYANEKINGIAVGGFFVHSKQMNGLALSLLHNDFECQRGVSISIFNKTKELHGFQFGLINYAGNNRKIFKWIPLINFNLKKASI